MDLETLRRETDNRTKPNVWFSEKTLWWTNSKIDLIEATNRGKKILAGKGEPFADIRFCDPMGYPVKKTRAKDWMAKSLSNPKWFGPKGLAVFVFTHHANCQMFFSNTWKAYSEYMDREPNANK